MAGRPLPILPLVFIAGVIIAAILAVSTAHNVVRHYQLRQQESDLRTELRQLDSDHEQLTAVRDYLKSDEYVEDVARRTLGLVMPGEKLVIVNGPPGAATPTPDAATLAEPWWKRLFVAPDAAPTPEP